MDPTREEQRADAEPAARAAAVVGPGLVSPARTQLLLLQRHAGNRAVARLLRADRTLQRDDVDQSLVPLDDGKDASASVDRFDGLDPSNGASKPAAILEKINPAAPAFNKRPCTQNCPAAASAAQNYLLTGSLPSSACSPLNEPSGYEISPGPDSWPATGKAWADAWKGIQGATGKHGTLVIVEADRGANKPDNLTQWHYFVVMNARGHRVAVDAFLGEVDADVEHYVKRLGAKSFSYTSERMTAKPVRP